MSYSRRADVAPGRADAVRRAPSRTPSRRAARSTTRTCRSARRPPASSPPTSRWTSSARSWSASGSAGAAASSCPARRRRPRWAAARSSPGRASSSPTAARSSRASAPAPTPTTRTEEQLTHWRAQRTSRTSSVGDELAARRVPAVRLPLGRGRRRQPRLQLDPPQQLLREGQRRAGHVRQHVLPDGRVGAGGPRLHRRRRHDPRDQRLPDAQVQPRRLDDDRPRAGHGRPARRRPGSCSRWPAASATRSRSARAWSRSRCPSPSVVERVRSMSGGAATVSSWTEDGIARVFDLQRARRWQAKTSSADERRALLLRLRAAVVRHTDDAMAALHADLRRPTGGPTRRSGW